MTGPLVSVVMPVRNEQDTVVDAIRSVLGQTHRDLELLVVDGRSDDATRERIADLARVDTRIRLLDNPEKLIPAALNVGLTAARGEVLTRIDGHATVNDCYLERALAVLARRPEVAAVGGRRIGVAFTPSGRAIALALSSPFGVGNSLNHYLLEAADTDHASFPVYRTEVVRTVGGWDERLPANEDVDLDHRVLLAGHAIAYDPDMHILWRVRERVGGLARQYRRYGRGKAAMIRKNGAGAVSLRHLAPPALVTLLAAASALAGSRRPGVATALVVPYAAVLAAGSAQAWRARPSTAPEAPTSRVVLPAALATMHVAWGVGFIEGLAGRRAADGSSGRPPRRVGRARRR